MAIAVNGLHSTQEGVQIFPSIQGTDYTQQTNKNPGIMEEKQIKRQFNFHPH